MGAVTATPLPDVEELRRLAGWAPPLGVVSVAVSADPGDRSEAWRLQLRDDLRAVVAAHSDDEHERRIAVRATAERLIDRFVESAPPPARTMVGFAEVARDDGDGRWYGAELPLDRFPAAYGPRPRLAALVELVDIARRRTIVVLSSERVRILELVAGRSTELRDLELTTYEPSWRERKAQRPRDPARGHATSSSGKDQFGQRLDANRERWLGQVAGDLATWAREEDRREILILGETHIAERFIHSLGSDLDAAPVAEVDAISEPEHKIAERVTDALPELERTRQAAFVEQATDSARSGGRGALGLQETAQALGEGRVDRLLIDPERSFDPDPELARAIGVDDPDGWEPEQWLIATAITTGAAATPVRGDAAASLEPDDGVAAILRY
jgi:hypothetical protein